LHPAVGLWVCRGICGVTWSQGLERSMASLFFIGFLGKGEDCSYFQSARDAFRESCYQGRMTAPASPRSDRGTALLEAFRRVRAATERLAAPLSAEDQTLQSMPDASPTKWHRAHTTWFFETFVLAPRGIPPVDPAYALIYNSYYEALGPRHARPERGMLSRPSAADVGKYRATIDARVTELILGADARLLAELAPILRLGVAHEEQHQELLLTDILHAFSRNPLAPAYRRLAEAPPVGPVRDEPMAFHAFEGGLVEIGARDGQPFSFDNEQPRHRRWVEPFSIGDRLVTVGELVAFIRDGGYETPSLWLSEGWSTVQSQGIRAPLHARFEGGKLVVFGLDGEREARDDEPVCHVSFYEADALARFLEARLPSEAEWELAAAADPAEGNFVESGALRPLPAPAPRGRPRQLFGDAWEWTRSSYEPYPGFVALPGALGEYNGKFMVGQMVLRGGSCFTPSGHVTASYRNFWPPATRFQLTGVRLARDIAERRG
jgi:ergothioneine biosynthesis protein EgtB